MFNLNKLTDGLKVLFHRHEARRGWKFCQHICAKNCFGELAFCIK